jgi:hypothetical protein
VECGKSAKSQRLVEAGNLFLHIGIKERNIERKKKKKEKKRKGK